MSSPRHQGADSIAYVRRDPVSTRVVYRAQVVLRILGPAAARAFMKSMRLDATLIERVLRGSRSTLRR
jgi:hypothetical protein